jgi:hypothetical protein
VIQRRTQTAAYWQDFEFSAGDVSFVYERILDKGQPVSTEDLVKMLIERHCRLEEESIRGGLSDGKLYQPKATFEVGEQLIFPALGMITGTVRGTRPGHNPEYGEFIVLEVELGDEGKLKEFASDLSGDHVLNRLEGKEDLLASGDLRSVAELYEAYGDSIEERVITTLADHEEFVRYRGDWFLRDLMAAIGVGQLNIAEALIEIKGMPLQTADFLSDLDMAVEIPESVQMLSLNHALDLDKRFDNIGDSGRDLWYLRRLIPKPVVEPPKRLHVVSEPYDRSDIAPELLAIEREIDDEASGTEASEPARSIYRASLSLTYPHWRCGTLPLTRRIRKLFPQATRHHTPVVLVDGQTGNKMQGWIVHESSFVYGLENWYKEHKLPVGAQLRLERTRDPRVITVDYSPQRLKPTWVKIAVAEGNRLGFQVRKIPLACEYDELLAIGEDNPAAIDRVWQRTMANGVTLYEIMVETFPELVKLSPQATVHAKTVYTAVNILRRLPPGPIFALLSTEPCFVSMGGGYWTFDQALVKQVSERG